MCEDYAAAGYDPAAFWSLSPRLYLAHMRAAAARAEQEHQQAAWMAWHIAALMRQETLPDFDKFASGANAKPTIQHPLELQANLEVLAGAWGAERI